MTASDLEGLQDEDGVEDGDEERQQPLESQVLPEVVSVDDGDDDGEGREDETHDVRHVDTGVWEEAPGCGRQGGRHQLMEPWATQPNI